MDINETKIFDYTASGSGNGLAAALDLEAGDVIIEIANPYIVVVEKASLDKVCSQCLLEIEQLKRCARCKVAQYCSTACQKEAWNSMHRLECSALAKMPDVPPTPVRALMQVLLTHAFGTAPDPRWRDLKTNQDYLSKTKRYPGILLQARAACQYTKFSPANALEVAVGILCRMSTNAFRATSAGSDPVGLCFEPVIALANHSCLPNAAIVFDGRRILLRALDPIKKDNQIFISYVDGTQRRATRQAELKEAYFFTCMCKKCAKDETPYQSWMRSPSQYRNIKLDLLLSPKALQDFARLTTSTADLNMKSVIEDIPQSRFDSAEGYLGRARETPDPDVRLRSITQSLETLRSFRENRVYALPPYPSILHELYLYYIDIKAFSIALSLLLFMYLHCHVYSYPQPNHPLNVERLYTIAKLCGNMIPASHDERNSGLIGDFGGVTPGPKLVEAIASIDWFSATESLLILVADLAPLSHGKDTRFTQEAAAMLEDVEAAQRTRPDLAGDMLKQWCAQGDGKGKAYAQEVFEGLRRLGGNKVVEGIMDMGLHLLR